MHAKTFPAVLYLLAASILVGVAAHEERQERRDIGSAIDSLTSDVGSIYSAATSKVGSVVSDVTSDIVSKLTKTTSTSGAATSSTNASPMGALDIPAPLVGGLALVLISMLMGAWAVL